MGGIDQHGHPEDNFTPEPWLVLEMLIEVLQVRHSQTRVVGHYHVTSYKTCPNFVVEHWVQVKAWTSPENYYDL